jgi:hypothetical protein
MQKILGKNSRLFGKNPAKYILTLINNYLNTTDMPSVMEPTMRKVASLLVGFMLKYCNIVANKA